MNIKDLLSISPLLFDGAMGTELQKRGLQRDESPELFLLAEPGIVEDIHASYISAGSGIIETNTFGANRKRLEVGGLADKLFAINTTAAQLALNASGNIAQVAASIGPLGAALAPFGELSQEEALDIFSEQISILKESGINIFLVETMISLDEAVIAVKAAKALKCDLIGATLTFEIHGNNIRTPFGESLQQVSAALLDAGADFIGSNCGQGFEQMLKIALEFRASTDLPLLVQPNAGLPDYIAGETIYRETPSQFAEFALKAKSIGIEFIGGCCGTTPLHINAARITLGL